MIVYRAETVVANLIAPFYEKSADEIRMVVKELSNPPIFNDQGPL
jgi:hypothetical protein